MIKMIKFWCVQFLAFVIVCAENDTIVILTKNGQVRGTIGYTEGLKTKYYAFRGVPYGEAPVGQLRFEPATLRKPWSGVFDATEEGSVCKQGEIGSEDCLSVNIYTTSLEKKKLPVIVWVYGGTFTAGSAVYEMYGPDYFLDKDVIIASFNYRVNIFGFFSTGDSVVPGNMALKDHVLALKWFKQNIHSFGGDPDRITVYGGSSGAITVSYLLQSPTAKGLFVGAIMQSGVSLCPWGISRSVSDFKYELTKELGLNSTDSKVLVDHLKGLNATDLYHLSFAVQNKLQQQMGWPKDGSIFAPVIEVPNEHAFMTEKTHQLLAKGNFYSVPTIVGFNSFELNYNVSNVQFGIYLFTNFDIAPQHFVPLDMNVNDTRKRKNLGRSIKKHYLGNKWASTSHMEFMRYLSDDQFVRPTHEFVRLLSKKNDVYFYRFDYEGEISKRFNKYTRGVVHGEELSYYFITPFRISSKEDVQMRDKLLTLWTNFAKYGNPTPKADPKLQNIIWPSALSQGDDKLAYINLDTNFTIEVNPEDESMRLWTEAYKEYGVPPFDTY